MRKIASLLLLCVFFTQFTSGQSWVEEMQNKHKNFYEIQQTFNQYWENKPYEKGKGWKQFKRWEYLMEPRVYPTGEFPDRSIAWREHEKFKAEWEAARRQRSSNTWSPIGPSSWQADGGWNPGIGRVNVIVEDPNDPAVIYIGAPAGGLWKSTDAGSTWLPLTDQLAAIGVSGIAIDPNNSDHVYISTGDGDGNDTYSIGVLKSEDGGQTWNVTGLNWQVDDFITTRKLVMHPTDPAILWVATNEGIFKTTDSGATWQESLSVSIYDIEVNPANPDIIFASGDNFYKSTDGGDSFDLISNGTPSGLDVNRLAIAVTPDDASYVYILASSSSNSGFHGFYLSTDTGESFTLKTNTPNLLGWSQSGGDSGGQGWYDLAVAASPNDADEVFVGGVNAWKSTNGGSDFEIVAHWNYPSFVGYVHADIHTLEFFGTTLYCGSDGGIFYSNNFGEDWNDLTAGLQITQFYRLGGTPQRADLIIAGTQDNGTNLLDQDQWSHVLGADGMEAAIDYTDSDIMYGCIQNGSLRRSTNGGQSFGSITSGINENGAWVTPYEIDPQNPSILYAGYENVWKSTNRGDNWEKISDFFLGTLRSLAIANSDPNYIYTANTSVIYRTTDGGDNWDNISSGLPTADASITAIEVHPTNPEVIWVTFSGYEENEKVYTSIDGGDNWINISDNLPNLPVNCVVYQIGSLGGIYVGTDVGVYYTDSAFANWQPYMEELPNVIVQELEINYGVGKIRAATFGRGMWEADLFSPPVTPPIAQFTSDFTQACAGQEITFFDLSINAIPQWEWEFEGGTPATSDEQNPTVIYNQSGYFPVKLKVVNDFGEDSVLAENYVLIMPAPGNSIPITEGFESLSDLPDESWFVDNPNEDVTWELIEGNAYAGDKSTWLNNFNNSSGKTDELVSTSYDLSQAEAAKISFRYAFARRSEDNSDRLRVFASKDCGETWALRKQIVGGSLATVEDTVLGEFFPAGQEDWELVEVTNISSYLEDDFRFKISFESGGGNNIFIDNINLGDPNGIEENNLSNTLRLYPNPAQDHLSIEFDVAVSQMVEISLTDLLGKEVLRLDHRSFAPGSHQLQYTLPQWMNGIYLLQLRSKDLRAVKKIRVE